MRSHYTRPLIFALVYTSAFKRRWRRKTSRASRIGGGVCAARDTERSVSLRKGVGAINEKVTTSRLKRRRFTIRASLTCILNVGSRRSLIQPGAQARPETCDGLRRIEPRLFGAR